MNNHNLSIKSWSKDDRPREKLIQKGARSLSNSELLAIILGSGTKDESALGLAKRMMASANNDVGSLGKLNSNELQKFKGIGQAKAISILAAMELGKRRKLSVNDGKVSIGCSQEAYELIRYNMEDLEFEEFRIIFMNRRNQVIKDEVLFVGGVSSTVVDPKRIYHQAIQLLASSIIVAHNHPSGSLKPSNEDIKITKKLIEAGKLLDIALLDHLIITNKGYLSMVDEGYV